MGFDGSGAGLPYEMTPASAASSLRRARKAIQSRLTDHGALRGVREGANGVPRIAPPRRHAVLDPKLAPPRRDAVLDASPDKPLGEPREHGNPPQLEGAESTSSHATLPVSKSPRWAQPQAAMEAAFGGQAVDVPAEEASVCVAFWGGAPLVEPWGAAGSDGGGLQVLDMEDLVESSPRAARPASHGAPLDAADGLLPLDHGLRTGAPSAVTGARNHATHHAANHAAITSAGASSAPWGNRTWAPGDVLRYHRDAPGGLQPGHRQAPTHAHGPGKGTPDSSGHRAQGAEHGGNCQGAPWEGEASASDPIFGVPASDVPVAPFNFPVEHAYFGNDGGDGGDDEAASLPRSARRGGHAHGRERVLVLDVGRTSIFSNDGEGEAQGEGAPGGAGGGAGSRGPLSKLTLSRLPRLSQLPEPISALVTGGRDPGADASGPDRPEIAGGCGGGSRGPSAQLWQQWRMHRKSIVGGWSASSQRGHSASGSSDEGSLLGVDDAADISDCTSHDEVERFGGDSGDPVNGGGEAGRRPYHIAWGGLGVAHAGESQVHPGNKAAALDSAAVAGQVGGGGRPLAHANSVWGVSWVSTSFKHRSMPLQFDAPNGGQGGGTEEGLATRIPEDGTVEYTRDAGRVPHLQPMRAVEAGTGDAAARQHATDDHSAVLMASCGRQSARELLLDGPTRHQGESDGHLVPAWPPPPPPSSPPQSPFSPRDTRGGEGGAWEAQRRTLHEYLMRGAWMTKYTSNAIGKPKRYFFRVTLDLCTIEWMEAEHAEGPHRAGHAPVDPGAGGKRIGHVNLRCVSMVSRGAQGHRGVVDDSRCFSLVVVKPRSRTLTLEAGSYDDLEAWVMGLQQLCQAGQDNPLFEASTHLTARRGTDDSSEAHVGRSISPRAPMGAQEATGQRSRRSSTEDDVPLPMSIGSQRMAASKAGTASESAKGATGGRKGTSAAGAKVIAALVKATTFKLRSTARLAPATLDEEERGPEAGGVPENAQGPFHHRARDAGAEDLGANGSADIWEGDTSGVGMRPTKAAPPHVATSADPSSRHAPSPGPSGRREAISGNDEIQPPMAPRRGPDPPPPWLLPAHEPAQADGYYQQLPPGWSSPTSAASLSHLSDAAVNASCTASVLSLSETDRSHSDSAPGTGPGSVDGGYSEGSPGKSGWVPAEGVSTPLPEGPTVTARDLITVFSKARHGHAKHIEDLFRRGLSPYVCDASGNSVLTVAAQNNQRRVAKLVLRWTDYRTRPPIHRFVNHQNNAGNTALHYSFAFGFVELANFLLTHGADDSILNYQGCCCYDGLQPHSPLLLDPAMRLRRQQGGRYASDQIALKSTICQERRHGQVMAGPEHAPRVPTTCLCYTLAVLDPAAGQGGGTKCNWQPGTMVQAIQQV
eukprot:jgi/Mesvir1/1703/Mv21162-RA.1